MEQWALSYQRQLQEQHKYDDSFLQFRFASVGDSSASDA
jgi:hypothetical protein